MYGFACVGCPAGYAGTGGTCNPCLDAYYQDHTETLQCVACNNGGNGATYNSNGVPNDTQLCKIT